MEKKRRKYLPILGLVKSRLPGNSVSVPILTGRLFIPRPVFTYPYKPQLGKLKMKVHITEQGHQTSLLRGCDGQAPTVNV